MHESNNKITLISCAIIFILLIARGYFYSFVDLEFSMRIPVECDIESEPCFIYEDEPYKYLLLPAIQNKECEGDTECLTQRCETESCVTIYCDASDPENEEECAANTQTNTAL